MNRHTMLRCMIAALAGLVAALLVATAGASPEVGSMRPDAVVKDAWDRQLALERLRGVPILVVYEDKGSSAQNAALKEDLAKLAKGDKYKKRVALVAVADVAGYDYWPVRGFVKDAIQEESHKQGTVIYCDWDGTFRNALGLQRGQSNVVLYGKNGKVIFSSSGALSEERRKELIALLRREVDG